MDATTSGVASMFSAESTVVSVTFVAALILFYPFLLFFGGVMLYYFTGHKPGEMNLRYLMRVIARFYSEAWMLVGAFMGAWGLGSLFKVVLGALFPTFTYQVSASASSSAMSSLSATDLRNGITMILIGLLIFAAHWGMNYYIESKGERRGTLVTKMFSGIGLALSSVAFFVALSSLTSGVIEFIQKGASTYGVKPGGALALMMAAFPLWIYFVVRSWWLVRNELAGNKK